MEKRVHPNRRCHRANRASMSNAIHLDTSYENLEAFMRTAYEYGREVGEKGQEGTRAK
jgi:hypothetical protein